MPDDNPDPGPGRRRRVRLISTCDPYTRLTPGAVGTILHTDDLGTIAVRWDSGEMLGLIPGIDRFEIIND